MKHLLIILSILLLNSPQTPSDLTNYYNISILQFYQPTEKNSKLQTH